VPKHKKAPIDLTENARVHLLDQLREKDALGIVLKLRTRGCSGLSYTMDYAYADSEQHQKIPIDDQHFLFIHPKALLFVIGTEMDYQNTPTRSGFVFHNPNEKGRCGCGSSFHV
jgi:iron-sulfur cluster assembly protein